MMARCFHRERLVKPGDWSGRQRIRTKAIKASPQVMLQIEKVLIDLWEELPEPEQTLWALNCLYYAGAMAAYDSSGNTKGETDKGEPTTPQVENEHEDESNDSEDEFAEVPGPDNECIPHTPGQRLTSTKKRIANLKLKRKSLQQVVGWIEAELQLSGGKQRQRYSGRRRRRVRQLRKLWPKTSLTHPTLAAKLRRYKDLVRIRSAQIRAETKILRNREAALKLHQRGAAMLEADCRHTEFSPSEAEAIALFWRGVWGQRGGTSLSNPAIQQWRREVGTAIESGGEGMPELEQTAAWELSLKSTRRWRAPGPDLIHGHWFKAFPKLSAVLGPIIWDIATDPTQVVPQWLVEGRTVMLPKGTDPTIPGAQRPITCLNLMYKLLTGTLARVLMRHVTNYNLLPPEQKALRKGARGCMDALAIDAAVVRECKEDRRNCTMVWLDFRKAFDRVPHKWLKKLIRVIQAPRPVQTAIGKLMPLWRTNLELRGRHQTTLTFPIRFRRGVFQGDTLSPLLFGLALAPLSTALRTGGGFNSKYQDEPITHLAFMDDVKLFEESHDEAEAALGVAESAAKAVGMELGEAKCGVVRIRRGRHAPSGDLGTRTTTVREVLSSYKYLGVDQLAGTRSKQTIARVTSEYLKRVRQTWRSNLNSRKTVGLHNSYCVGVLRYFCQILHLSVRERVGLDRRTRRAINQAGGHHPNASVDRLYLPRNKGGRGLQRVEDVWEQTTVSAALYTLRSQDPQMHGVARSLQKADQRYEQTIVGNARAILGKHGLQLNGTDWDSTTQPLLPIKKICLQLRQKQEQEARARLERKQIHGVFAREVAGGGVDGQSTHRWLTEGLLVPSTEATIVAAQDGVTHTRAYRGRVQSKPGPVTCRLCGQGQETLGHILSACPVQCFKAYTVRHNRVLYLLVKAVMQSLGLTPPRELKGPGGTLKPGVYGTKGRQLRVDQLALTIEEVSPTCTNLQCCTISPSLNSSPPPSRSRRGARTCLWCRPSRRQSTLPKWPAHGTRWSGRERSRNGQSTSTSRVTWPSSMRGTAYIRYNVEVACSWDSAVSKRERGKKYQPLAADISKQWKHKVTVIPLVIGVLGTVKAARQHLRKLHFLNEAQIELLLASAQREALVGSLRTLRQHMKLE